MAELPHPWGLYALQQQKLSSRFIVKDATWGIEASLNAICEDTSISIPSDLARTAATASRRERYRATLRRHHLLEVAGSSDWVANAAADGRRLVETRSDLLHLRRTVSAEDLNLLVSAGSGTSSGEIAATLETTAEAVRARLTRTRRLALQVLS